MTEDEELIEAYRQMYEHTFPECGQCKDPYSCCNAAACDGAIAHASQHWGVVLEVTGHPTLPLMGPKGCVAAPHLRPLCTVHACEISNRGFKKGDPEWTDRYYVLREKINNLEYDRGHFCVVWETGPHGTISRKLSGGFRVTLGTSDSAFPPGEDRGLPALNSSALWLKVDVKDHERRGYPFPLGWWARCSSVTSLAAAKGMVDRNGYTLPAELAADYWRERVFQLMKDTF